MRFLVTTEARNTGVLHPVVAVYGNLKQLAGEDTKVYDAIIEETMARIKQIREEKLHTPQVQGYSELFTNLDPSYKKLVPAGQRLINNFERTGSFKRYGNLVDSYNLVALQGIESIGTHDARVLLKDVDLVFRRALGTEKMVPSFRKKEEKLKKGDLTYGIFQDGQFKPFAWLGKRDEDNSEFQLKPDTTTMLMTAIGNMHTSEEHNIRICEQTFEYLKMSCPEATMQIYVGEFVDDESLKPVTV